MNPKVSILIPCYNAERWIAQSIESALNQTYPNKEVIVVDDGSTDGSLEIIKSFGDSILWETGSNQGGNVARNRLLELSTGEWLQYLDADDYLLPDKIEDQISYLNNHGYETDIIYSPVIVEYPNNNHEKYVSTLPEPDDPWILLIKWQLPQTGGCLWKKQTIIELGGWKIDQPCCQEHELYSRFLIEHKNFLYSPKSGAVYRIFGKNTVSSKRISETYKRRLEIIDRIEKYIEVTQPQNYNIYLEIIHQTKFECARIIWNFNEQWAIDIVNNLGTNKTFMPSGNTVPRIYKICYRLFGFYTSEKLASSKRLFQRILKPNYYLIMS